MIVWDSRIVRTLYIGKSNGLYPVGTVCRNAECKIGGVYMSEVRKQTGVCKCTEGFCLFDGIQQCETLYQWRPETKADLEITTKFDENAPNLCRVVGDDSGDRFGFVGQMRNGACWYFS